jgi:hypothetical protein
MPGGPTKWRIGALALVACAWGACAAADASSHEELSHKPLLPLANQDYVTLLLTGIGLIIASAGEWTHGRESP